MLERSDGAKFLENYELGSNATLFSFQGGLRASASDLSSSCGCSPTRRSNGGIKRLSGDSLSRVEFKAGDNGRTSGEAHREELETTLMTSYGLSVHRIDMRAWGFVDGPRYASRTLGRPMGFSVSL